MSSTTGLVRRAADHDRVEACALACDREVARGERVGQHPGKGRLRDDGELGAGGEGRTDEWGEHEGQGRLGRERVDARGGQMVHEPCPEPGATEVRAEHGLGELDWRRRAGADVHEGGDAEVAGWRLLAQSVERRRVHPPASALTSETRSPAASGSSGSRLI